jgi:16S rRNA (cytosine1402-N4)-methyltransferase
MHIPVLQKEVLEHLNPKANENFIDCTVGQGGHSLAILERNGPRGKVLGIEADPELYKNLSRKLKISKIAARLILVNDSYTNLKKICAVKKFKLINGILLDLGMSSWHLEESNRGFSFKKDEPLDMRYNPENPLTAKTIVNFWSKFEIERILREYGEERRAERIAKRIIEERRRKPIETTAHLRRIINQAGSAPRRSFQALRIAVNNELDNLKKVLPQTVEILEPGGRLVVISFHSLEDRIVKNFFKEKQELLKILTKKPVCPSKGEVKTNPRSSSAKLRAAEKQ